MRRPDADDDDTIRVARPAARRRQPPALLVAGGVLAALLLIGGGGFLALRPAALPPIPIDTETEAQIDSTQPCTIQVSHFAPDPDIVVLDFPNLTMQGQALDRVAAFVEKAGLPRDRVLNDSDLAAAIAASGSTVENYYYGHDYKVADLQNFFRLADADGIRLNPQEGWLRSLLAQLGWLTAGANGALITVPAAGGPITPEMRAVILHHEISHGAFYTIPAYAGYALTFWNSLTSQDRAAFTHFLGSEGYDTTDTTLIYNETQAYLIFTTDPRFFNGSVVGMTQGQIDTLRAGYIAGMPQFWLTKLANETLPIAPAPAACPAGAG
jgi:hypothetical protein